MSTRRFLCRVLAVALSVAVGLHEESRSADAVDRTRHALLIGCSDYLHLPNKYDLHFGPDNDVKVMRRLLVERFAFAPDDITTLVHENNQEFRPYLANITREMERLAKSVAAGDEVVILLAGHGSQQANDNPNDPSDPESDDGLDEIFLPEDVTHWDAEKVVGGISDDQIRDWLAQMQRKDAFVFFIADTCHSGTITRGPEDEPTAVQTRHLPPEIFSSRDALEAARGSVADRTPSRANIPTRKAAIDLVPLTQPIANGGLVSVSAVPDSMLEKQEPMPPPRGKGLSSIHGRLTFALSEVLFQTARPLSYRELGQQIAWKYQQWGWQPYCLIEGTELDREVLGKRDWTDRSRITLTQSRDNSLQVSAGLVHGVTLNSVLAVYPPASATDTNSLCGYVKVTAVDLLTATVVPTKFGDEDELARDAFPLPGRCELVHGDFGDLRITLKVKAFPDELTAMAVPPLHAASAKTVGEVRETVGELAALPFSLLRLAEEDEGADVFVLVSDQTVYLCRTGIDLLAALQARQHIFGPYPIDDQLLHQLQRELHSIAQGLNLRRLARPTFANPNAGSRLSLTLEKQRADSRPWIPITDASAATFMDGDRLRVQLSNAGPFPIDATLFYQDSAFKRQMFAPAGEPSGAFELLPGHARVVEIKINDQTTGLEDMLVFAVTRTPDVAQRIDFQFLLHPGLEPAKLRSDAGVTAHPIERLLQGAVYGMQRGEPQPHDFAALSIERISIRVAKKPQSQQ